MAGGIYELLSVHSIESVLILVVLALILVIVSVIFTLLPAKSKDWFETEERIK